MATYILFWNPAISSYTLERFAADFKNEGSVGNWSFFEHEDVKNGDRFYMMHCGESGNRGIVMAGVINSECFESDDWSPKNRKHIFYADIEPTFCINSEATADILTPDILTEAIPGFDWFGGHSGRKLDDESARKLDRLFIDWVNNHPRLYSEGKFWIDTYAYNGYMSREMLKHLMETTPSSCQVCGYDYEKVFGPEIKDDDNCYVPIKPLKSDRLPRVFYAICENCLDAPMELIEKKLSEKV